MHGTSNVRESDQPLMHLTSGAICLQVNRLAGLAIMLHCLLPPSWVPPLTPPNAKMLEGEDNLKSHVKSKVIFEQVSRELDSVHKSKVWPCSISCAIACLPFQVKGDHCIVVALHALARQPFLLSPCLRSALMSAFLFPQIRQHLSRPGCCSGAGRGRAAEFVARQHHEGKVLRICALALH